MLVHPCAMFAVPVCLLQEIVGILLAVSTFADLLRNRKVVLYSDNKGTLPLHGATGVTCGVPVFQAPNTPLPVGRPRRSTTTSSCTTYGCWCSSGASTYGLSEFPPSTILVTPRRVVSISF